MCIKRLFFWRKKEEALKEAKKLENEKLMNRNDLKKQDERLTKEEKQLKRVFSDLQISKMKARKKAGKKKKR